jgi:hypothetical protein
MAEFASPTDKQETYPKTYKAGSDNNSAGLITPYKVNTGATRGVQKIKGTIEVVDNNNVVRLVMGYKKDAF